MNGKNKCKILKDIRRQIARSNEIAYVTSECKFQGECSGTCPKCEAELRYLEEELAKRKKAGKAVAVAGLAAAFIIGSAACTPEPSPGSELDGDILVPEYQQTQPETSHVTLPGSIVAPSEEELMGEPVMGDLPPEYEEAADGTQ